MSTRTLGGRFFVGAVTVALTAAVAFFVTQVVRPGDPATTQVIQDELDHPWDIAFAPDGRMLVTERIGRVLVFASAEPGAELLSTTTIPDVRAELESGLMGIAVDGTTVYVCASRDPGGDGGEPWRVDLMQATLAPDGSLSAFESLPIGETIGGPRHQGCAVEAAEGFLWVTIGDANMPAEGVAQRTDTLNGKVLRLELDGSVPDDNPFDSPIYSLGHRNPQGIAIREDGLILDVEHGTDTNDEINVIQVGGNYGYPCWTGAADVGPAQDGCGPSSDYLAPAWASGSPTLATSGAAFLTGGAWGDWDGDLIVSTLKEEDLRRFSVSAGGEVAYQETLLDGRFGRLRAVVIGPDGALYVSSSNGSTDRIVRVTRSD
ncbi:MAG TPA: PQQ-dependent sugar dehydrogenase [Candidatus Limnocylindria bacterium]|nr:PQQ-dependent sugar dehydrogenase [Candidatus Limnocylindria bacterium]